MASPIRLSISAYFRRARFCWCMLFWFCMIGILQVYPSIEKERLSIVHPGRVLSSFPSIILLRRLIVYKKSLNIKKTVELMLFL